MEAIVKTIRKSFQTNLTLGLKWRCEQLEQLHRLIDENENEMCEALKKDLSKPSHETIIAEFVLIKNAIVNTLNNIENWVKIQKVTPLKIKLLQTHLIQPQPLGVVLIIGAWNYPYQLLLVPLVGVLASGNCAVLKPSELSPHSSELLEKLIPKYFDKNFVRLINGGISETTELLKQRFDHIFYTGSTFVGKIVMEAAAKHMTPVTLECGGKSPCFIDSSADLEIATKRIIWGKFMNNGQTCIAPDYILCTKQTQEKIIPLFEKHLVEFYGQDPQKSDSYGRIVNQRHFKRILNLLDESKVVIGGKFEEKDLYISPTVMKNCSPSDRIMLEEIFGPLLPILTVSDYEDAIEFINDREKPLSLYVFANNEKIFRDFTNKTSSGSMAYNECIMQVGFEILPFGGVGESGMGKYHGKYSFETFTHYRTVLKASSFGEMLTNVRYPPYTPSKTKTSIMANSEIRETFLTRTLLNRYFLFGIVMALASILFLK